MTTITSGNSVPAPADEAPQDKGPQQAVSASSGSSPQMTAVGDEPSVGPRPPSGPATPLAVRPEMAAVATAGTDTARNHPEE